MLADFLKNVLQQQKENEKLIPRIILLAGWSERDHRQEFKC